MERFIETPNILNYYDYALLVNCSKSGPVCHNFFEALEKVLRGIDQSFLVVLVAKENRKELSEMISQRVDFDPRIRYELLPAATSSRFTESLLPCLGVLREFHCSHYIIINADGSDRPEAIPKLIKTKGKDVVFVDKGPKADNFFFWLFYRFHQLFFWLLTGRELDVDHYSMINRKALDRLLERPFLHYATALYLRKLKVGKIRHVHSSQSFGAECGKLFRRSTLALLEFGEDLLMIFFRFALGFGFLLFGGLIYLLAIKGFTQLDLPGWLPIALVGIFNALLLSIGFFSLGALLLNRHRQEANSIYLHTIERFGFSPRILDN